MSPQSMTSGATPPVTRSLAAFAANAGPLPATVSSRALLHVADTLACIYAGSRTEAVAKLAGLYAGSRLETDASQGAVVPGLGRWSDAATAALLTGLCAHAEDFDDTSARGMSGHPSAPVVSALLATLADTRPSGADVLLAYAIGVEVACKLGRAVAPAHAARGWHTMSTLGAIGAAVACARLRALDADGISRAIGIATSLAGGLLGNTGTMVKGLHCAHAAWAGFTAAALSATGFTARIDALERPWGFLDLFAEGAATDPAPLETLGAPWELVTPGIELKPFPSCSCTHPAIAGALSLRSDPVIGSAGIAAVDCWMSAECASYLSCHQPASAIEGKFSIEYTVACALVRGHVVLADFTDAAVTGGDVAGVMSQVHLHVRPEDGDQPDIALTLSNGLRLTAGPLGTPPAPDWAGVAAKMRDCSRHVLAPAACTDLLAHLSALETSPTVALPFGPTS